MKWRCLVSPCISLENESYCVIHLLTGKVELYLRFELLALSCQQSVFLGAYLNALGNHHYPDTIILSLRPIRNRHAIPSSPPTKSTISSVTRRTHLLPTHDVRPTTTNILITAQPQAKLTSTPPSSTASSLGNQAPYIPRYRVVGHRSLRDRDKIPCSCTTLPTHYKGDPRVCRLHGFYLQVHLLVSVLFWPILLKRGWIMDHKTLFQLRCLLLELFLCHGFGLVLLYRGARFSMPETPGLSAPGECRAHIQFIVGRTESVPNHRLARTTICESPSHL